MKLRHRTRQYKNIQERTPGYGVTVFSLRPTGHSEKGPLSTMFGIDDIFMLGDTIVWRVSWK